MAKRVPRVAEPAEALDRQHHPCRCCVLLAPLVALVSAGRFQLPLQQHGMLDGLMNGRRRAHVRRLSTTTSWIRYSDTTSCASQSGQCPTYADKARIEMQFLGQRADRIQHRPHPT
ncbi:MAG: hypothetical protein ACLU38_01520 [Dysosmobacter sp.]